MLNTKLITILYLRLNLNLINRIKLNIVYNDNQLPCYQLSYFLYYLICIILCNNILLCYYQKLDQLR